MTIGQFSSLTSFCEYIIIKKGTKTGKTAKFSQEASYMTKLDSNKKKKEDSLLNTAFGLFTSQGVSKTSIYGEDHFYSK